MGFGFVVVRIFRGSVVEQFIEYHRDKCGKQPDPIGLSADVTVDGLLFRKMAGLDDAINLGVVLKNYGHS